jgi:choline dehydrogenase-like flavoprotein
MTPAGSSTAPVWRIRNHPDDLKTVDFLVARQKEILDAAGCTKIWPDPGSTDTTCSCSRHPMGTRRMGNGPQGSVVECWNRTQDVHNPFIVDGSSLVTSGRQ